MKLNSDVLDTTELKKHKISSSEIADNIEADFGRRPTIGNVNDAHRELEKLRKKRFGSKSGK